MEAPIIWDCRRWDSQEGDVNLEQELKAKLSLFPQLGKLGGSESAMLPPSVSETMLGHLSHKTLEGCPEVPLQMRRAL